MEKHLVQGSSEWLEMRKKHLGASDAPIIMGVSPYCTPYQLWRYKLGLDEAKPIKPHMQKGLDIEDEARDYFFNETGYKVEPRLIKHPNISYMTASLDGLDDSNKIFVEIKRPCREDHEFVKKHNKPPEKYWPQLQHQLECLNIFSGFYLSYYENDPVLTEVFRDQNYIETLIGKEASFYNCMMELIAPELTDKDYITRTDTDWVKYCMEYREYQEKIKVLEKNMEKAKKKIINMAEGKNCKGSGVSICHVMRKGNVDYSAIPELSGIDLDKYRKNPIQYEKISIGK